MNKVKWVVFGMVALVALAVPSFTGQARESGYIPLRTSRPMDFPAEENLLLQIRNDQDVSKMRDHAWSLFAGLNQPAPIWGTWFTKCDVKLALQACAPRISNSSQRRVLRGLEIPAQALSPFVRSDSPDRIAQFFQAFRQNPQFASVLFNRPAARHILDHQLYSLEELEKINQKRNAANSPETEREIPPFPMNAVVLKTAWQVVYENGDQKIGPLYVWNESVASSLRALGPNSSIDDSNHWGPSIMIDTTAGRRCEDHDYENNVPLACFFYYEIKDSNDLASLPVDLIKFVGSVRPGTAPAFLILVAMHVITKETPDWVWSTFWWDNHASQSPFAENRPTILHGKWRHFLMDTTLSADTPRDPLDQKNKICFNPYLEVRFPNGIVSNCVQCHQMAIYHKLSKSDGYDLGLPWRDGRPANGTKPAPDYFKGALKVDFMWSIANRQDQRLASFLDELQIFLKPQ